ncbi:hypothetical protein FORC066_1461 [Yersinia enterocolitica]|nr:hypothetical protein FORC066_1461 [Yersinia enterocolitica]
MVKFLPFYINSKDNKTRLHWPCLTVYTCYLGATIRPHDLYG